MSSTRTATGAILAILTPFSMFCATSCNAVTGADEIRIDPDFDGGEGGDTASTSTGGPASGAGGATTGQGSSATGTGSGATTGSGTGSGSGSGSGSTTQASTGAGMGGDPGPTDCIYPPGPYGVGVGQIVPPTITWQGYAPGAAQATTIRMEDLHDCDGTRGIHALYFDTSQFG